MREELFKNCTLCPRKCNVNRLEGKRGYCGMDSTIRAARAALHMWEEPCISGKKGSGAVFFSGCGLRCCFCQNRDIAIGDSGKEISVERLAEIFLELQEKGAANLNLVTGAHYVPHIISALELARGKGMNLPVVYNSSGYENVETIRKLDGYVDVYLPDMKYMEPELAAAFCNCRNDASDRSLSVCGGWIYKTRDNCSSSDFARAYPKFYCSIEISVPDLWGGYFYQRNEPIYACLEE